MFLSYQTKDLRDNKDSWKIRKSALEDIENACKKFEGLSFSTSPEDMKGLTDLMKALRSRLDDSQSNLKPIAARNMATILNAVDASSQVALGKIVYGPLFRAAMNDNKKIVRDAALEALNTGTLLNDLNGGGINSSAMEPLIAGFVSELEQSEYKVRGLFIISYHSGGFFSSPFQILFYYEMKATGLPDVLNFLITRKHSFSHMRSFTTSKTRTILSNFARTLVGCLSSSKSETRALAESL